MALVLVVEDNAMNRKLIRDILEIRFEVIEANDAEEGIKLLDETKPDLILMDLQLPGMDGLTLVRQLKSNPSTQDIPIVAVSAHAMEENIDEARAAGCLDYVTKPLVEDPFDFVDRLEKMIEHP
jgi:two-component system cell cycle response regulator/two-component system cell cycle response regulator DivK